MGRAWPGSELRATLAVAFRLPDDDFAAAFRVYLHKPVRIRAIERAMRPLLRIFGFPAADGTAIRCTEVMVDYRRFTDGQALHDDVLMHWNRIGRAPASVRFPESRTQWGAKAEASRLVGQFGG